MFWLLETIRQATYTHTGKCLGRPASSNLCTHRSCKDPGGSWVIQTTKHCAEDFHIKFPGTIFKHECKLPDCWKLENSSQIDAGSGKLIRVLAGRNWIIILSLVFCISETSCNWAFLRCSRCTSSLSRWQWIRRRKLLGRLLSGSSVGSRPVYT